MTDEITKRSLEEQATDLLRRRIVSGDIAAGDRLVETPLAQRYGLSRGTIRAALRRLVEEGLVMQVPYAGYRVMEFTDHDLWEIFTLRGALEGLGARLAAEHLTPEGERQLRTVFEALMTAADQGDHAETSRLDFELHSLVIRLSGNERLAHHYARVENQFRTYIALSNLDVACREVGESHRDLVEAICAGDGDRAEQLARANIAPPTAQISTA